MDIRPSVSQLEDLEEILLLQKSAYRSEAEIHNDFSIPPLYQTLAEINEEFRHQIFLIVKVEGRIVASVRAYQKKGTCYVGKLIVDSAFQNRGIGTVLLTEIEKKFSDVSRFELFTGYKSEKNLYLYAKKGYREFKRQTLSERLTLVFLEKQNHMS